MHGKEIELFLQPETEVLVARDGADVVEHLATLTPNNSRAIGAAARARILREHTYARRATKVDQLLRDALALAREMAALEMRFVFLGLSLSSSWGNGHATTYRALLKALHQRGHDLLFLEREQPWYAAHRDLPEPDFCTLRFYDGIDDLRRFRQVPMCRVPGLFSLGR